MSKTAELPVMMASAMLPFLELPKIIENNEGKSVAVTVRVQPTDISYYYPGVYTGIVVVMKSGSSYLVDMDIMQLDQVLASYHSAVSSNPAAFGNLSIKPKTKIHAAN